MTVGHSASAGRNIPSADAPLISPLDQTINANAASRLTGVTTFINNFAARLKWMVTKSTRATFISLVHEMAGIVQKEDTAAELQSSHIRRGHQGSEKGTSTDKVKLQPI